MPQNPFEVVHLQRGILLALLNLAEQRQACVTKRGFLAWQEQREICVTEKDSSSAARRTLKGRLFCPRLR